MANAEVIKVARGLLLVNLAGYVTLAATGAWLIDAAIDTATGYSISDGSADTYYYGEWTAASGFANLFAMVAGVVGAAAALPGLHHVRAWSQGSLPAAAHTGFMAWLLTLLALGLGIKEIIMGASVHVYTLGSIEIILGDPVKLYLAFAISRAFMMGLLSVTQLCYLRSIFYTAT